MRCAQLSSQYHKAVNDIALKEGAKTGGGSSANPVLNVMFSHNIILFKPFHQTLVWWWSLWDHHPHGGHTKYESRVSMRVSSQHSIKRSMMMQSPANPVLKVMFSHNISLFTTLHQTLAWWCSLWGHHPHGGHTKCELRVSMRVSSQHFTKH